MDNKQIQESDKLKIGRTRQIDDDFIFEDDLDALTQVTARPKMEHNLHGYPLNKIEESTVA